MLTSHMSIRGTFTHAEAMIQSFRYIQSACSTDIKNDMEQLTCPEIPTSSPGVILTPSASSVTGTLELALSVWQTPPSSVTLTVSKAFEQDVAIV